jgi:hypothetical protein
MASPDESAVLQAELIVYTNIGYSYVEQIAGLS